jgi:hypothetical protein
MSKKPIGGILVLLIAVASVPLSYYVSLGDHLATYLVNGLPALVWGLVLLIGSSKSAALADTKAVVLGMIYGGLVGVGGYAALYMVTYMLARSLLSGYPHPYDAAAFTIIALLSVVLFFGLLLWDLSKHGGKRLWVRVLTALVTFLPVALTAIPILGFLEKFFDQYV